LPGIEKLQEAGFTTAALTNSPPDMAREQLENAGLANSMKAILSVDASKYLKPARIERPQTKY
jgi:FMN phosphatase YigB (HAD superfamily)